uniref:DUF4371 domain-containing protein n=1 Tax=Naja naja TaxID=35670 RepID=A0A8C6XSE7_NAJNA
INSIYPKPLVSEESRASTSSIEESGPSTSSTPQPEEGASTSSSTGRAESDIEGNLPDCWTLQQYNNFREKHDGLDVSHKKLGCKHCRRFEILTKEKSVHGAKEWKNYQIEPSGRSKEIQQASLRKKLKEHFSSKAHNIYTEKLKQCEQDVISKGLEKMSEKYLGSTCRVFIIVYSLAQTCRPFSYIEDLIELQKRNGLDLGTGLHSRRTAVAIVDFIAKDIRKHLFTKIIEKTRKICLIIDEASTISSKPTYIVQVIESLNKVGFNRNYLEKHLIGFCSDGASVMLGRKSGVSTRIEIKQINHFQIFIDKIYSIFHQSNKNLIELNKISEQLEIEIIKIGRVFGPRWTACSLRSTLAVMAAHLENSYFLTNLALMIDVLTEISLLSNALQARNIDIIKAEKLVLRSIRSFEIEEKGCQFKDIDQLKFLNYLEPDYWNIEEVVVPWRAAEGQLVAFGQIFNYEININDYCDFIENVLKDSKIIQFLAFSRGGKGFSQMNIICSEGRSRLTVSNITNLLTISLIGLPLQEWDPVPIVKKWLWAHITQLMMLVLNTRKL